MSVSWTNTIKTRTYEDDVDANEKSVYFSRQSIPYFVSGIFALVLTLRTVAFDYRRTA